MVIPISSPKERDPRLPSILSDCGAEVTDDTGNMLEIEMPNGRKYMVYKVVLDVLLAAELRP